MVGRITEDFSHHVEKGFKDFYKKNLSMKNNVFVSLTTHALRSD